ncbi:hypothetical protein [Streptomyces sp. NPDC001205]
MTTLSMPHNGDTAQPVDSATIVLGVDTHKDVHVAAVVSVLGALLGTQSFPAIASGYRQLANWARSLGVIRKAGVEGTGSYGAGLAGTWPPKALRSSRSTGPGPLYERGSSALWPM